MIETLRQTWRLIGPRRSRWLLLVVVSLIASGFEMFGAILVFVLIGLVADPGGDIELPILGDVRSVVDLDERTLLLGTVIVTAVFFVVRGGVQIGAAYAQHRIAQNTGARLASRLARGYLLLPYPTHLRRDSSDLVRNSYQAVQLIVRQVFIPVINVAASAILTIGMLSVLVAIAPLASAIAVAVVGSSAAIVLLVVQPRLKRLGSTAHDMQRETLRVLQQSLHGIRDIRILGRERFFAQKYGESQRSLARSNYLRAAVSQLPSSMIELALIGFILLFFTLTIVAGERADQALPVLGLFAYVGLRLQPSIQRMVSGLNNVKFATAPVADLYSDLEMIENEPGEQGALQALPFADRIEFKDVEFRYEGTEELAIDRVSLTIEAGEELGICGPTGGGKTTLTDLIAGLLVPTSGKVTVDGVDLGENQRSWHRNLGVVPQMVFLTDDTLRRNIAFGVADGEIDEDALQEAIRLAQLEEFIDDLPEGLETTVGERGVRISGGQRQRIAIARALYRRPSVLIFDEGTSALDQETEKRLMHAIEGLRGSHTVILVAHRLSTVQNCDRVVFVEKGRVTGIGTFDELTESNETFRRMVAAS